ncbi:MAG TPA: Rne/Rng family ribonuclease [Actinomycetota bacterium]|nr:Rne/Rng family ribonuclease [Actinomycetota bacterium]
MTGEPEAATEPAAEETETPSPAPPARRRRRRRSGSTARKPAEEAAKPEEGEPEAETETETAAGTTRKPRRPSARTAKPKAEPGGKTAATAAAKRQPARKASTRTTAAGETSSTSAVETAPKEQPPAPVEEAEQAKPRRRRRRRRKPTGAAIPEGAVSVTEAVEPLEVAEEAPPAEPVASAPPAPTRTSRMRRRGPIGRRHREPSILPRRQMDKTMLITERGDRDQIAVVEGRELVEHYVTRVGASSMVGNIYFGRVQNVLPGMEAAFVDVGRGRNAVLYAGEVSYDEEVEDEGRRIEQALKPGQGVLVQVTKDPMGGKGARLTGQISLPGRYLVYVPDGGASGISRRLPEKERARLRDVMKRIRPSGAGVIVRTAAEAASEEELAADLERLKKGWDSIKRKSRRAKPPKELYEEPELTVRVIRDVFSPVEYRELVTDSKEVYERVTAYLREVAPDLLERVRLHEGPLPLMEEFHVAEQIHKALERKVWLSSGGYLIIDRTEAMTVIDVNTGKAVGKSNLEETVVGTNLEAAREIARQLRLRDIGGIIVIDFIDMLLQRNREQVIFALKEALAQDKTRSQVFDITPLGLLELTRKRVSAGLVESFSETCPTCEGRGILVTHDI